ncbi:putative conserved secreted protein [Synechococcus sp. PROS-9-1]|nr:putative conserved secreted protein [Synechococcus sp. PROS-9-1]
MTISHEVLAGINHLFRGDDQRKVSSNNSNLIGLGRKSQGFVLGSTSIGDELSLPPATITSHGDRELRTEIRKPWSDDDPSVNAAVSMKTHRLCLPLLLLALGGPSSVHASCDIFSTALNRINAEEQESLRKARKKHVKKKCGTQSQSWIGGAAGSRRFEYLNCKLSARNSEEFKKKWAVEAATWQAKRENIKTERFFSGCSE